MKRQPMTRSMDSSKGVGEVRRVHVVYFLCRNGKIEQPHLIRVHHLHRNGVHLRDVKRWLSELRGKDMPETFAWSYKRRYKAGYVWQDLLDDDLITPISDNEYVLKGSELPSKDNQPPSDMFSCGEETPKRNPDIEALEEVDDAKLEVEPPKSPPETLQIEPDDNVSPKPPPRLDQESPGAAPPSGSDGSSESSNQTAVFKIDLWKQHKREEVEKNNNNQQHQQEEEGTVEEGSLDSDAKCRSGRSYHSGTGRRASNVFRNLLGCKPVEANESVQIRVNRLDRDRLACREISGGSWSSRRTFDGGSTTHRTIKQDHNLNNSGRKSQSTNGRKSTRKAGERVISAVYKPVGGPNCSQCRKTFKPEKLHSHMKSCKALRGVWKV